VTALVITHTESEDPGRLATWLPEEGLDLHVVEPWRGDALPESLDGYGALVVMGGPQQAWSDEGWLPRTRELLREAVARELPTFGVCLGAQLLAQACGGRVTKGQHGPEVGAKLVGKRDVAGNDPLFWDLPLSPLVVQWHWDAVIELPPGSTLLMAGTSYEHQAFRVGSKAWGIQFHVEADAPMIERWAEHNRAELEADGVDVDAVLARAVPELDEVAEVWGEVLRRFARLAA
jgi:GMP synthase-like glutamine amidotransferase